MKIVPFIIALATALPLFAQQPAKFGKVSADELKAASYAIDPGAEAVVLFDVGSTEIKGNKKNSVSLEFKRHCRIHILKKNAYDFATLEVPLYTAGEQEELLEDVRAVSYNLENGKVVETKLDKESIFKEKVTKNFTRKKFTVPNVKEGTIIEYEYKIISDFHFNMQPWSFQGSIPTLWSEYKATIPEFLNYTLVGQGSEPFFARDQIDKRGDFWVERQVETGAYNNTERERININCGVTQFSWAMKDVPALNDEAYITTLNNYNSRLEFQLSGYREPFTPRRVMNTWPEFMAQVSAGDFNGELEADKLQWASEAVTGIVQGSTTNLDKAKKIYAYVRDNLDASPYSDIHITTPLKDVFKKKAGTDIEINLILTALLRQAGIFVQPVLLSTRSHGYIYPKYPIRNRFNHVIARAIIDEKEIFLDASDAALGFGRLSAVCYNGQAKIVDANATTVTFNPDQLTDTRTTKAEIKAAADGKLTATVEELLGEYESMQIRRKINDNGEQQFVNSMKEGISGASVKQFNLEDAKDPDKQLKYRYSLDFTTDDAGIMYVDPLLTTNRISKNPFKAAKRKYPVEMMYKKSDSYQLVFTIPPGYVVDELPTSILLKLNNESDIAYEYTIMQSGNEIKLTSKFQTTRTRFEPSEYNDLRAFFDRVVAKQNEQIVLKKK